MKRLIIAMLLAALLASAVNYWSAAEPGYIYIAWLGYSLEMTVWLFLLSFVALVALIFGVLRLTLFCLTAPFRLGRWVFGVDESKLQSQTAHALAAYEEGHWQRARKSLVKIAQRSKNPLVFYLMAARASHNLGEPERVDEYLNAASEASPSGSMAISLTQAQLQLVDGALENCLATLIRARAIDEEHPEVVRMLAAVYDGLSDWSNLYALLPQLKKLNVVPEQYRYYVVQSANGLLAQAAENDADAVLKQWREFASPIRQIGAVLLVFAELLETLKVSQAALPPLQAFLRDQPEEPRVLLIFARIAREHDAAGGLTFLSQLAKASNTMALNLAQARLALAAKLPGQYAAYLDQAASAPQKLEADWVRRQLLVEQLAAKIQTTQSDKTLVKVNQLAQEISRLR